MTDNPKTWGEMTPEEKGALPLAHHYRKEIQFYNGFEWAKAAQTLDWLSDRFYRVKPAHVHETVILFSDAPTRRFEGCGVERPEYAITFDTIDGEPVCDRIRMEKLK
jgi:hypothetical protein